VRVPSERLVEKRRGTFDDSGNFHDPSHLRILSFPKVAMKTPAAHFLSEAERFATAAHGSQLYDGHPYFIHLRNVVHCLNLYGVNSLEMLAAGWLHDILEDTNVQAGELITLFGPRVGELVYSVTNGPGKNRTERLAGAYQKIRFNRDATILKLADRIANVEYSIKQDSAGQPRFLKMYRREYPEFRKQLRTETTPLEPLESMWETLDGHMSEQGSWPW